MSEEIRLSLREKQSLFARMVPLLILKAYEMGYEVTFGETWRTPEQALANLAAGKGISNSLHLDRLAIDLNLFKNGRYLSGTEEHRPLGIWWEGQHMLARWGGRFGDGNHYSLAHNGRK